MSNPNPLVPQGSLLEQQARSKSTFQMAAFIVALHVVVLGGFLFLGCKKEDNQVPPPAVDTFAAPPPISTDTNFTAPLDPFGAPTNTAAYIPPVVNPGTSPGTSSPTDTTIPAPYVPLTPQPVPAPVPGIEHVVQKGDTAYVLARRNGVSLKQLQEANPGRDLARLKVGDRLSIPASTVAATPAAETRAPASMTTYTVKGGDNLSRLAKKHGTTVKAIREANGLTSNDIKVGQSLKIPTKSSTPAAPSPAAIPTSLAPPVVTPGEPVVLPGTPANPQ